MSEKDQCVALLRYVLFSHCQSDSAALRYISYAKELNIDPLDYCAHMFGIGNVVVWQRAAQWSGYTFANRLPSRVNFVANGVDWLDNLGSTRSLQSTSLGQTITYIAPRFREVVALRAANAPKYTSRLRFVTSDAIEAAIAQAANAQLTTNAQTGITRRWPAAAAAISAPLSARVAFAALVAALLLLVAAANFVAPVLMPLTALLLMPASVLRLLAAVPRRRRRAARRPTDAELPVYTVLLPLRDEAEMVPNLARAMSALDYPPHKLDIKFVVEADSPATVAAVEDLLADARFRLVVVPESAPHTKPKAIDYALPLARGELLVIYDAEDVPMPDQLRRAAARFLADPELTCLQARLVVDNARENPLTALYAGEYAGLFERLLPAMARWRLPLPLGGTSNHFRTARLREIGGWDAYNVTEDADLGVRLARRGHVTRQFKWHGAGNSGIGRDQPGTSG